LQSSRAIGKPLQPAIGRRLQTAGFAWLLQQPLGAPIMHPHVISSSHSSSHALWSCSSIVPVHVGVFTMQVVMRS
jgi:hypothetical protein